MNEKIKNAFYKVGAPLIFLIVVSLIAKHTGLLDGMDTLISINLETVVEVVVAIAFVMVIGNVLLGVIGLFRKKSGRVGTLATLICSLIRYAMILFAGCWVLSIIGVNVSTIFASIGIVALIIGFGAESLVADLVTGIFILFENEYNVGDIIEVDGFRGTVKAIGIRTLSLEDSGKNIKIINNSDLKNIINRSNHGSTAVCEIGVSYETDLEALEPVLEQIGKEIKAKHEDVFKSDIRYLGVEELGDSAITLKFCVEVDEKNIFSARRLLNKEMKIAFDKHNISIPYPQLDVHMN